MKPQSLHDLDSKISILSTKHTFLAVHFLGLFSIAPRSVIDPDVRWRLKIGE
jgi:hypothetical protein